MPPSERIVIDPRILAGKPVIHRTRLAVEVIPELHLDRTHQFSMPDWIQMVAAR